MDSIVVSARRDHPLRAKEADFEDLARAQWIVPNPNVLTRMKLTELFHARGLDEPLIQIESDFIPYITEMVARTDLLSYMPQALVRAGNLGTIRIPGTVWKRSVSLSYWRRHTLTSAGRMFIALLESAARDMHAPLSDQAGDGVASLLIGRIVDRRSVVRYQVGIVAPKSIPIRALIIATGQRLVECPFGWAAS